MGGWQQGGNREGERGALWVGVLLIAAGCLFLAGQQVNIRLGDVGWPLFIIVPGLILFFLGLLFRDETGLGMTIPGGIITTIGLLLLYQSTYDAYASWAYAWALIAPGSVGVSLFVWGLLHGKLDLVDAGLRTAAVGLGLFVGLGLLFENVIGLENTGSTKAMRAALPILAVILGVIIVVISILPTPRGRQEQGETQSQTWIQGPPNA
jgi:hypothetical protein